MVYANWTWVNEPAEWDESVRVVAEAGTDLWRQTHYGYTFDSAHQFGRTIDGDLTITTTFDADYAEQYDQAGAVIRIDELNWIKTGVEWVDGTRQLSAVVTRGFSDWSVVAVPGRSGEVTIHLERTGDAVTIRYGLDGAEPTQLLRLAYFPPTVPALAGIMCAAPTGQGFEARFSSLQVFPAGESSAPGRPTQG